MSFGDEKESTHIGPEWKFRPKEAARAGARGTNRPLFGERQVVGLCWGRKCKWGRETSRWTYWRKSQGQHLYCPPRQQPRATCSYFKLIKIKLNKNSRSSDLIVPCSSWLPYWRAQMWNSYIIAGGSVGECWTKSFPYLAGTCQAPPGVSPAGVRFQRLWFGWFGGEEHVLAA